LTVGGAHSFSSAKTDSEGSGMIHDIVLTLRATHHIKNGVRERQGYPCSELLLGKDELGATVRVLSGNVTTGVTTGESFIPFYNTEFS
jgi:hypothetical protein